MYLDAAATTPVRPEALAAMWPYLTGDFGNPSSHHTVGESAARGLRDARASVARWLGCRASEVVFTSGGTEADNLAVKGIALGNPRGRHIVTTRIEHEAVLGSVEYLRGHHGFAVSFVEVDEVGSVHPDALRAALRDDTTLVSIAHANNEVGTVQQLEGLTAVTRDARIPFHTDAVQTAGWLDLDVSRLGVQAISLSGHKLGAPKGIGVLQISGKLDLEPVVHGGGQERGRRSGTENVAGAVALGAVVGLAETDRVARAARAAAVRDGFIGRVAALVPESRLTGAVPGVLTGAVPGVLPGVGVSATGVVGAVPPAERLPASASFVFPGTSGESVLLELERRGIVSSSGSACAAGSDDPSHVLVALGYPPDIARTAVRFTWAADVDADRMAEVAVALAAAVAAVGGLGAMA